MSKALIVSYDINPNIGSEATKAHYWLLAICKYFDIDVFVHSQHREAIEKYPYPDNIKFIYAKASPKKERFLGKIRRFDKINRLFIDSIENEFIERVRFGNYDFVHFLSPSGIHSYNTLYKKLGFSYVIGPLGGGLPTPSGFGKLFSSKQLLSNKMRSFYYRRLKRNPNYVGYLKNAAGIIVGTDYLFEYMPEDVRHKTIVHFDTLVDVKELNEVEKEERQNSRVKIVYSGRLSPQKGIEMLIEALVLLKKQDRFLAGRLHVDIFGDGPLRHKIDSLISKYALDNIVFMHGKIPRTDLIRALKLSDIYCLPTIRENGGQAIIEAMAAGLPIITSDYGGPKFSVTDECGIKIPVENHNSYVLKLADAIKKLALDKPLRQSMGIAGKKRVYEKFSLEALKNKIPEIYANFGII